MNIRKLDREFCGDIWTSDSIEETLREIASFDSRLMGSEGERIAQKAIVRKLRGWGIETRYQRFKADTWQRGESRLRIPGLKMDLPCLAYVYSASTGGRARTFEILDLYDGTPGDIKRNRHRIRGKAILFSRKDYEEIDRPPGYSRVKAAVEAGAKAFVVGTFSSPGVISTAVLRVPGMSEIKAPVVSVSAESVALIKRAMAAGFSKVSISTEGRRVPAYTGNVIGTVKGRRKGPEIILGAHLDSFDIAPGADDNGSGVAVVLEMARLFGKHRVKPDRTVRFLFFTGEEFGRIGSEKYAASVADPGSVGIYFNFDLPANGGYPRLITMTGKSDPDYWFSIMKKTSYRFPVREIISRASDHYSFYRRGIPCIWEISNKSGSRSPATLHHTEHDTLEYVNINEMKEAATMAAKITLHLCAAPLPFRPLKPEPEDSPRWDRW